MNILVYGSLRSFHRNNSLLGNAEFIKKVEVPGFALHAVSWFPGIVENPDKKVVCELYKLNTDSALERLDGYEGFNPSRPESSLFIRKAVTVEDTTANIYVFNGDVTPESLVESGDWQDVH